MSTEQLAILFTDLVGSTELSQAHAPDTAEEMRRQHTAILRQAITEHGGTEVKNLGDGVMVAFGSASAALACLFYTGLIVNVSRAGSEDVSAEVAALKSDPRLHAALPSMRAVGYRQTWEYLDGQGDLGDLEARGIAATRQLAKRQLTWLRAQFDARWFDPETQRDSIERALDAFLGRRA